MREEDFSVFFERLEGLKKRKESFVIEDSMDGEEGETQGEEREEVESGEEIALLSEMRRKRQEEKRSLSLWRKARLR